MPNTNMKSKLKPIFTHDCTACIFLGQFTVQKGYTYEGTYDLYWCPRDIIGHSAVARYDNGGSEYYSGMLYSPENPIGMEIIRRCLDRGLITSENVKRYSIHDMYWFIIIGCENTERPEHGWFGTAEK